MVIAPHKKCKFSFIIENLKPTPKEKDSEGKIKGILTPSTLATSAKSASNDLGVNSLHKKECSNRWSKVLSILPP